MLYYPCRLCVFEKGGVFLTVRVEVVCKGYGRIDCEVDPGRGLFGVLLAASPLSELCECISEVRVNGEVTARQHYRPREGDKIEVII